MAVEVRPRVVLTELASASSKIVLAKAERVDSAQVSTPVVYMSLLAPVPRSEIEAKVAS